jgi:hypothetical protein
MGRDTWRFAQHEREREAKRKMNPIWRGVGCVLLVAMAIAGYAAAGWFIRENAAQNWVYLPPVLINVPYVTFLPGGMLLQLFMGMVFMILGYGVLAFVYALAFPVKPGETDVPPLRRTAHKRPR